MNQLYANWKDVPKEGWRWPNFSPREIACKGTGGVMVVPEALDKLQTLRNVLGRPLLLTSAYRSPAHNRKVGGAPNSLHMQGIAFDVRMENQDPVVFERAARKAGFTGFGYYPKQGFMHIDTGPARSWGTPFDVGATDVPPEPAARQNAAESTTIQASAVQLASGAGAAVTGVAALEGSAQIIAVVFGGTVILAALWIMRERLRRWAEGDR